MCAQKRMFNLQIVDTDAFLEMPVSTQALYFHLVMRADDEGFVGNPKKIMKLIGSQDDDFKLLIAKRFIITFDSGIIVIKHWLIHNTIRMDRFNQTNYQEEKKQLKLADNKSYTELWQPDGNQMATDGCLKLSKVKLSKDLSSEKNFNSKLPTSNQMVKKKQLMAQKDFDEFWNVYPRVRRVDKKKCLVKFLKIEQSLLPQILNTLKTQKESKQWQDSQFIPMSTTWLNQTRWDMETVAPTIEQEIQNLKTECYKKNPEEGENWAYYRWGKICRERGLKEENYFKYFNFDKI